MMSFFFFLIAMIAEFEIYKLKKSWGEVIINSQALFKNNKLMQMLIESDLMLCALFLPFT